MKGILGLVLVLAAIILQTNADDAFGEGGYVGLITGGFCSIILVAGLYMMHQHFERSKVN